VTLTSADGTAFSAYLARADGPVGVVVLPDVRGLFRFYGELAERLAAAGYPAIAFDYFGRSAGLGPRDEDFEFRPHVMQTRSETVAQDVAAAIDALGTARVFTFGFCFGVRTRSCRPTRTTPGSRGRRLLWLTRARRAALGARPRARAKVPVLGLFAGSDESSSTAVRTSTPRNRRTRGSAYSPSCRALGCIRRSIVDDS
jgi:carboxymethylenebutenolidase